MLKLKKQINFLQQIKKHLYFGSLGAVSKLYYPIVLVKFVWIGACFYI